MNRLFVFSIVALLLTSCGGAGTATPTAVSGIGDAAVELIQQDMYLRLTQQAIDNERIETGAKMTATQQVINATATQQTHNENARATQRADSATQQAWQVTVEAGKAQDAATAQAASSQATATAEWKATATEAAVIVATEKANANATATADYKTLQAPIVSAQATAIYVQTKKTEIELQKTQATMWVSAWGGWVFAIVAMAAAGFMLWKKSQVGVVPTDNNGRMQMVIINDNGRKVLVRPDVMAGPALEISKIGSSMPQLVAPEIQREVTHGAQVVEAVRSLPPGYQRQALGMAAGLTPQNGAQINIQVVNPNNVSPVLDEVEGGLLDGD